MHKKTLFYSAAIFLVAMIALGMAGCSTGSDSGGASPTPTPTGNGVISGCVLDDSGNPLSGATVTLTPNEAARENATTDENGDFSVGGLVEGTQYVVIITYPGMTSVKVFVNVTTINPAQTFVINMVNGTGTVTLYLPTPANLTGVLRGAQVNLDWTATTPATADEATLTFDRYLLYRGTATGVDMSDTLVMEETDESVKTYGDVITTGTSFYYNLFKRFVEPVSGVKIAVASNEVAPGFLANYVFDSIMLSELGDPEELAVYDADKALSRIYIDDDGELFVFNADGTPVEPPVVFQIPENSYNSFYDVEVDSLGNVYGSGEFYLTEDEYYTYRIMKFSPDGTFLAMTEAVDDLWKFDVSSADRGADYIYLAAWDKINIYDTSLSLVKTINVPQVVPEVPPEAYWFDVYYGTFIVAVDPMTGDIFCNRYWYLEWEDYWGDYWGEEWAEEILVFDSQGVLLRTIPFVETGEYRWLNGMRVAQDGSLWLAADGENAGLLRYDVYGNLIQSFPNTYDTSKATAVIEEPTGVALDSLGNVYMTDDNMENLQKFVPELVK